MSSQENLIDKQLERTREEAILKTDYHIRIMKQYHELIEDNPHRYTVDYATKIRVQIDEVIDRYEGLVPEYFSKQVEDFRPKNGFWKHLLNLFN